MKSYFYRILIIGVLTNLIAGCSNSAAATQAPAVTASQPAPQETAAPAAEEISATRGMFAVPASSHTYIIDSTQSTAHFIVEEMLSGKPNMVDGKTNLVEGQIVVDYAIPSAVMVSPIKVVLTGMATDSALLNGTIEQAILQTGSESSQVAIFTPTKLVNLPDRITIDLPLIFKITGMLALDNVTKEVTFDVTVTPVSETKLTGTASAAISFADWGIELLRLSPQVASVNDAATLKLEFVANAQ